MEPLALIAAAGLMLAAAASAVPVTQELGIAWRNFGRGRDTGRLVVCALALAVIVFAGGFGMAALLGTAL